MAEVSFRETLMKAKKDVTVKDSNGRSRKLFAGKSVPPTLEDAYKAAVKEAEPKKEAKAETKPEVHKMETAPEVSKAQPRRQK